MGLKPVPSDEDLVSYLYEKVYGVTTSGGDSELQLFDCDLYGDREPWQIWNDYGGLKLNKGEDLYFFTKLKKLSINGSRFNRHTPSGTWSGVNRVPICTGIADKRYFKYKNRSGSGSESESDGGTWKMYEYSLQVDGASDPYVLCRLRREIKGQKRKLTNFIQTHDYSSSSSSSSSSVGDHHHHQHRMKKQRVVVDNLHVDAADDVIDFGFLFGSDDDEQDLKEITGEDYINKAAAVNVAKSSSSSTTYHHHYYHHHVDVNEEHSSYGSTENFVEIDDYHHHAINNVAKSSSSSSSSTTADHGDQIIFSEDDNDALLKLIFGITHDQDDDQGQLGKILPNNYYSDEQDLNEITREEYINTAVAVNVANSSSSTTHHHHHHHHHHHQHHHHHHHHHHHVEVVEEHSSYGGTVNFVEIDDDDHGIDNVAKSSSTSTSTTGHGQDHDVSELSSSAASNSEHHVDYNSGVVVEQQNGMELAEDDEDYYLSGKSFAELLQSVPLYYEAAHEYHIDDVFMDF